MTSTDPSAARTDTRIRLDTGWRVTGDVDRPGALDLLDLDVARAFAAPDLDDSSWASVTLPHTPAALSWQKWDPSTWERVWAYRHHFSTPSNAQGMRTFIEFGAAMTTAVVTLNGTVLGQHRGGYLPFCFEITDLLSESGNTLGVLLDSRFNQNVPPNLPVFAPNSSIDYWQPGGIHRDVSIRVVPQTYVSSVSTTHYDALDAKRRRSRFVVTLDSSEGESGVAAVVDLIDPSGSTVASARVDLAQLAAGRTEVEVELTGLDAIALWHTDDPVLYTVLTSLEVQGRVTHTELVRTGYREARWEKDGFFLNGERLYLFGVNRHGLYPYTGFSMPDRVQRRDATIIKEELNCNFVRCSHYPQAVSFLDACDELGILVWEESPGWQYVGDSEWQDAAVGDITAMIARDRHRPSIVIWGARLNETPDRPKFYERTEKLVKSLDPSRATSGTMHGDYSRSATFQHDVFSYDDYYTTVDESGDRHPILLPPVEDRPYLLAEAISSRSSPTSLYRRTEHARVQQHQALDYAQAHDIAKADERYSGIVAWVGFDYQAGFGNHYHGLKTSGLGDVFRILKPGASIFRSQIAPTDRPVIEPAFTWDPPEAIQVAALGVRPEDLDWGPGSAAMICSNLDRLEVFLGSTSLGEVEPDRNRFPRLDYAPSFVDLTLEQDPSSDLRIDGYLGAELVMTRQYSGDRATDSIALLPDDRMLVADGVDATRVVVAVVDRFGEPRGHSRLTVTLAVSGPGVLVGDTPFDLEQSGGVGAVWIRSLPGETGDIVLTATADGWGLETATVASVETEADLNPSRS